MKPLYHERVTEYNADLVQQLWEDCIMLDIPFVDPFVASSNRHYRGMIDNLKSAISKQRQQKNGDYDFERESFRRQGYSEQKKLEELLRFEIRMRNIAHKQCERCNCCSLMLNVSKNGSICSKCHGNYDYSYRNAMLPVWVDDRGIRHHDVPPELGCLSIGEKLLIQRVSPLVPVVHIKNGTLGIKGHVCSFMQDISGFARSLPLLPECVKAIRMIRSYENSETTEVMTKTYVVNRYRVMEALKWLCKYHIDYRDAMIRGELNINEENLDWMHGDEEADLCSVIQFVTLCTDREAVDGPADHGVSQEQCMDPMEVDNIEEECSGVTGVNSPHLVKESEAAALNLLKNAHEDARKSGRKSEMTTMDWPQSSSAPLSECSGIKIFANAFPWLFPGGVGDVVDAGRMNQIKQANWGRHMLFQRDGRFARDKLWCFFCLELYSEA